MEKKYYLRPRGDKRERVLLEEIPPPIEDPPVDEREEGNASSEENYTFSITMEDFRRFHLSRDVSAQVDERFRLIKQLTGRKFTKPPTGVLDLEAIEGEIEVPQQRRGRPPVYFKEKPVAFIIRDNAYVGYLMQEKATDEIPNRNLCFDPRYIGKSNWVRTEPGYISLLPDEFRKWGTDRQRDEAIEVLAVVDIAGKRGCICMIKENFEFDYEAALREFHGAKILAPIIDPVDPDFPEPPESQEQGNDNSSNSSHYVRAMEISLQEFHMGNQTENTESPAENFTGGSSTNDDAAVDASMIRGNMVGADNLPMTGTHLQDNNAPIDHCPPLLCSTFAVGANNYGHSVGTANYSQMDNLQTISNNDDLPSAANVNTSSESEMMTRSCWKEFAKNDPEAARFRERLQIIGSAMKMFPKTQFACPPTPAAWTNEKASYEFLKYKERKQANSLQIENFHPPNAKIRKRLRSKFVKIFEGGNFKHFIKFGNAYPENFTKHY